MVNRDLVVVAASAGGIEALKGMLSGLPPDYGGVVLVVLHMPAGGGSALSTILDRAGPIPATTAIDGEPLEGGRVYVCSGDHHLLLGDGQVLVRRGPRENGHRPAADPLFRSAAHYYGPRVVGVVLSGTLNDGTAGLQAVRQQGGLAIVQDPADAVYPGMPRSALDQVGADEVVPAADMGPLLAKLAVTAIETDAPPSTATMRMEVALMELDDSVVEEHHPGRPSPWPCPDCSGVLWEIDDGEVFRFRCRVGHAWAAEALLHEQGSEIEAALWVALRSLEDRAALSRAMSERAAADGRPQSSARFRDESDDMARSIDVLRRLLQYGSEPTAATGEAGV
jgi:two-component system chemotaxis response regulator CheB